MRITRLVAGTITGAIAFCSVGLGVPASAADTWTTTTAATPSETVVDFGDVISVEFDVDSDSGYPPATGTSTLLVRRAGSDTWREVDTTSSMSGQFSGVKPRMNSTFKVVYSGGRSAGSDSKDTYGASQSAEFTVQVARRITYPQKVFDLSGRVTPRYARKKIVVKVSREQNDGYTFYKTIRTGAKGRYKITLPRRGGIWYWSFTVRRDARYLGTGFVWKTFVS